MGKQKFLKVDPYFINGVHRITVSVIGAGGTGACLVTKLARLSAALNHLQHPGIYVKLIDYDIVEKTNVGRQLFTPHDVGQYKAENIIYKINHAFGYDWQSYNNACFELSQDELSSNITIIAVDNVDSRKELIKWFKESQKHVRDINKKYYLIDCGNGRDFGQVILSDHKGTLKTILDFTDNLESHDTLEEQGQGCSYMEELQKQDLFINDYVSLYAITMIKELLFNKQIDYQGFFFNTVDYQTKKIMINGNAKQR